MTDYNKSAAALNLLCQWQSALKEIGGCSDGNCVVCRPRGMHTNGGCKCSENRDKARRVLLLDAYYRSRLADVLGPKIVRSNR